MPVSPAQIRAVLDEKRDVLAQFDETMVFDLKRYRQAWCRLTAEPFAQIEQQLSAPSIGSHPLEPFAMVKKGVIANPYHWANREDSMEWVKAKLSGITTFAVDGSQIFPSKDVSLPIALVQIGWFENPHAADGAYTKDIALDVLTPEDLKVGHRGDPVDRRVNIRRFEMEVQRLVDYMETCTHPERTLVLFDGSLVVTFADAFDPESQKAYVDAMVKLLQTSQRRRVPLVGYIDTSYARDVTTLLLHYDSKLRPVEAIHDAQLLGRGERDRFKRRLGRHLEDGNVGFGIAPDDFCLQLVAVGKVHRHFVGVLDHVDVGDHDAIGRNDEAGPQGLAPPCVGRAVFPVEELIEEFLERGVFVFGVRLRGRRRCAAGSRC